MKGKIAFGLGVGAAVVLCLGLAGCGKERLATPQNVTVAQRICRWEAVDGAESYTVTVNGKEFSTQECSYSLYTFTEGGEYTVTVSAAAEGYSPSVGASVSVELEEAVRHGFDISGYEYWLLDDCSGYSVAMGKADYMNKTVVLPDYFGDYPVTEIADRGFTIYLSSGTHVSTNTGLSKEDPYFFATSLQLPLHLKRIGASAFRNPCWLKELTIPEGVEEIGLHAFSTLKGVTLKRLSLPSTLKKVGIGAFKFHDLEELTLPEGLEEIGDYAFQGNITGASTSMTELTIPASVKKIGEEAFAGNTKLERVEFLSTDLEYIGQHAFKETPWFESLPNGISALTDNAYLYKYEKLEESELRIPKEVVGISIPMPIEKSELDSLYFEEGCVAEREDIDRFLNCFSRVDTVRFPSQLTGRLPILNKVKTFNVPKGIDELPSVKPDNAIEKIYLECSLQHWQELLLGLELPDRSWYTGAAVYEYSATEPTKSGNYWHYVNGEIVEW